MTARLALWLLPLLAGAGCTIHTHSGRSTLPAQEEWTTRGAPRTTLITAYSRPSRDQHGWTEREGAPSASPRHEHASHRPEPPSAQRERVGAQREVPGETRAVGAHAAADALPSVAQPRTGSSSHASGKIQTTPPRKSGSAPRPTRKSKRVRDDRARLAEMIEHYASQPPARGEREQHDPAKVSGKATLDVSDRAAQLAPADFKGALATKK
jgi:hypothetical protein